jgi:uncharacterized protein YigA (DUF484 family)
MIQRFEQFLNLQLEMAQDNNDDDEKEDMKEHRTRSDDMWRNKFGFPKAVILLLQILPVRQHLQYFATQSVHSHCIPSHLHNHMFVLTLFNTCRGGALNLLRIC